MQLINLNYTQSTMELKRSECMLYRLTSHGSMAGGLLSRHEPQINLWYLACLMFNSSVWSVGGRKRSGGGLEVILTPSILRRQRVSPKTKFSSMKDKKVLVLKLNSSFSSNRTFCEYFD